MSYTIRVEGPIAFLNRATDETEQRRLDAIQFDRANVPIFHPGAAATPVRARVIGELSRFEVNRDGEVYVYGHMTPAHAPDTGDRIAVEADMHVIGEIVTVGMPGPDRITTCRARLIAVTVGDRPAWPGVYLRRSA